MAYQPDFIAGAAVPLPTLGTAATLSALDGGAPIHHLRFSVVFNRDRGFATYSAHNIDGNTLIPPGTIERRDRFRLDPMVDPALQVDNDRGYLRNPWDRGHLARRAAMHWGDLADATTADGESFYWTNIAPQHNKLQDGAWGKIENWMMDVADNHQKKVCVFTGPVFGADDPERTNRPGEKPFRIPAAFWKVMALSHNGALRAAGFLVWQRDFDQITPVTFDPHLEQVRITTIEHLAGLSFGSLRHADPLRFVAGAQPLRAAHGVAPTPPTPVRPSIAIREASDVILTLQPGGRS